MKTFSQFVAEAKVKTGPIKLFHGSHSKHDSLSLPKTFDRTRSADGHAVYLSSHKQESEEYGSHIHHVEFNAKHSELVHLDKSIHQQPPKVKKALHALAPEIMHKSTKKVKNDRDGIDAIDHLGKKHGYIKASELLHSHGIKGGVGESSTGKGKGRVKTSVYSVYHPDHLKIIHHEVSKNAPNPHLAKTAEKSAAPVIQRNNFFHRVRTWVKNQWKKGK